MPSERSIHPFILSGGIGSRLWPLSRNEKPKQFIPLIGAKTPLQDTALRCHGAAFARPTVICGDVHRAIVADQMGQIGIRDFGVILEPVGRNTCPAAAIAALAVQEADPAGLVLLMPSDHYVADPERFRHGLACATAAAAEGYLVTFGIRPTRPETGYGYIRMGQSLEGGSGCHLVDRFVEKPDIAKASDYLAEGGYFWNSGIFLFRTDRFLGELRCHAPDILSAAARAWSTAGGDRDGVVLREDVFAEAPSISIDYAVMEKTARAAVLPIDMGWSDLGTWSALWEIADKDENDNVCLGDAITLDTQGSYLRSDGPTTVVLGLRDVVVVAAGGALLVTSRERAQEVNTIAKLFENRRK